MDNFLRIPKTKRGVATDEDFEEWEYAYAEAFSLAHKPRTSSDDSIFVTTSDQYRQNFVFYGLSKGWRAGFKRPGLASYQMNEAFFHPTDDAERIDSDELLRAFVGAVNFLETSDNHGQMAYLDGSRVIAVTSSAVFSAPLAIPALAAAMHGAYLPVGGQYLRAMATALTLAKSRYAVAIDAAGITASVRVDSTNTFTLYIQSPSVSVTWEALIRFRRHLTDTPLAEMLTHEPAIVGSFDAANLLRAYRGSIRALPDIQKNAIADKDSKCLAEWEAVRYTALFTNADTVSVARVVCHGATTPEVADWTFKPVSGAESTAEKSAWRIIDGALLSLLPHLSARVHFGLSENDGPVAFWTDDDIRIAAVAASARSTT